MPTMQTFYPRFSKTVIILYCVVVLALFCGFVALGFFIKEEDASAVPILGAVGFFILTLFGFTLWRAYVMRYDITEDSIVIHGIFSNNKIKITDIQKIQTSPVPFGFRLFGASLLGGLYYFPGVGLTWVAMGNFKDGILIKTTKRHYFITPEHPEVFLQNVNHQ